MSTAQFNANYSPGTETSDQLPAALDSSNSKLVYLYLTTAETATITELQSTLQMKQLALFPVLKTLEGEDLIERDGETFTVAA
jgi:predicted transcriptional regulator